MNNKLLFLILSAAMVVLTIVTICTAPIINNNIVNISRNENCQNDIDAYDYYKKLYTNPNDAQKKLLIIINKMQIYVKEEKQYMV